MELQGQTNGEEDIQQNKKQLATAHTTQGILIHIKIIYGRNINRQHVACNVADKCTVPRTYIISFFPPLINWCCPETNGVFTRISPSSQFDLSSQCHTGRKMTMALDKPGSLTNQRETTPPRCGTKSGEGWEGANLLPHS